MSILEQTHALRWVKVDNLDRLILQQGWRNTKTGKLVWINVPKVGIQADEYEKSKESHES